MRNSHTASLGGVLELNMIAFVADLKPAIGLESFYDLPAIHEDSIHINTHSHKSKANYKLYNLAEKFRSVGPGDPDVMNLAGCCLPRRDIEGSVNLRGLIPDPALQKQL